MEDATNYEAEAIAYQEKIEKETIEGLSLISKHLAKGKRYFMLNLQFIETDQDVYRQITVPADITFFDLHIIIQDCFNWMDYHLFDFQYVYRKKLKMITERFDEDLFDDTARNKALEAHEVRLDAVFPQTMAVKYSYDYGDGWELLVTLMSEATGYGEVSLDAPVCNEGAGAVPPEDVGGWGGFEDFLIAINDKTDSEHEHMSAWGRGQGFEDKFEHKKINSRMAKWKTHKRIHEKNMREG